ncbi:MAG: nucleotidyltransferase substrate binding protein [Flavobacteriales bacterium]|nr:nucleotidyltransferase substrate binding protein [Flavobacteriales bacterium]
MDSPELDLTSFHRAVGQLEQAYAQKPANELARDGCIQRFEYTFELAWKMLRRHFALEDAEAADRMTKKDLFREAAKQGLITDPLPWFGFLEARNTTSHVYDSDKAEQVYGQGALFTPEARKLLNELLDRHA